MARQSRALPNRGEFRYEWRRAQFRKVTILKLSRERERPLGEAWFEFEFATLPAQFRGLLES